MQQEVYINYTRNGSMFAAVTDPCKGRIRWMNYVLQSRMSWIVPPLYSIVPSLHQPTRFYPNSTTISLQ